MFNYTNGGCGGYSLTDIATAAKSNGYGEDGFGGAGYSWIWIILIFAIFGWGRNGFGNENGTGSGAQGAFTRGDLCQDMNFSELEGSVRGIQQSVSDGFHGIDNAVCQLGYQNAQLINGIGSQISSEFRGTDSAICQLGSSMQQGFNGTNVALMQGQNALSTKISDCCCTTQQNIKDVGTQSVMNTAAIQNAIKDCCCENEKIAMQNRFDMQTYNCNTLQAIDKIGDRIIDYLAADKVQALRDENQTLRLAASQSAQNNYLIQQLRPCPVPAYITCNPYTASFGSGNFNGGCGCAA